MLKNSLKSTCHNLKFSAINLIIFWRGLNFNIDNIVELGKEWERKTTKVGNSLFLGHIMKWQSKHVVLHVKTVCYWLQYKSLSVCMRLIIVSLFTSRVERIWESNNWQIILWSSNSARNIQSTHFQSSQDIDENTTVEHWLRVDCCDGSLDFLERETLQENEVDSQLRVTFCLTCWTYLEFLENFGGTLDLLTFEGHKGEFALQLWEILMKSMLIAHM